MKLVSFGPERAEQPGVLLSEQQIVLNGVKRPVESAAQASHFGTGTYCINVPAKSGTI